MVAFYLGRSQLVDRRICLFIDSEIKRFGHSETQDFAEKVSAACCSNGLMTRLTPLGFQGLHNVNVSLIRSNLDLWSNFDLWSSFICDLARCGACSVLRRDQAQVLLHPRSSLTYRRSCARNHPVWFFRCISRVELKSASALLHDYSFRTCVEVATVSFSVHGTFHNQSPSQVGFHVMCSQRNVHGSGFWRVGFGAHGCLIL